MATLASSGRVAPHYSRPTVQARGASLYCPSTSAICTLGQTLARCPRTTLEVEWWLRGFRRASSTVSVQRVRHRHVAPCVVCVLGLSQLVVLAVARRPPRPTQFGDFPRKDALDAPLPPPASRHDPCVCVCNMMDGLYHFYQVSRLSPYRPHWRPRVGSLTPS